jgi:hypothetical protein
VASLYLPALRCSVTWSFGFWLNRASTGALGVCFRHSEARCPTFATWISSRRGQSLYFFLFTALLASDVCERIDIPEQQRAASVRERGHAVLDSGRSFRHRTKCIYMLTNLKIVGPSFVFIHLRVVVFPYAFLLL